MLGRRRRLPIVLGGAPEEMTALDYLASQRVRIALQGHAPFAAATQAVYETLKALREGPRPLKDLKGLCLSDRPRDAREAETKARSGEFLGLEEVSVILQVRSAAACRASAIAPGFTNMRTRAAAELGP